MVRVSGVQMLASSGSARTMYAGTLGAISVPRWYQETFLLNKLDGGNFSEIISDCPRNSLPLRKAANFDPKSHPIMPGWLFEFLPLPFNSASTLDSPSIAI